MDRTGVPSGHGGGTTDLVAQGSIRRAHRDMVGARGASGCFQKAWGPNTKPMHMPGYSLPQLGVCKSGKASGKPPGPAADDSKTQESAGAAGVCDRTHILLLPRSSAAGAAKEGGRAALACQAGEAGVPAGHAAHAGRQCAAAGGRQLSNAAPTGARRLQQAPQQAHQARAQARRGRHRGGRRRGQLAAARAGRRCGDAAAACPQRPLPARRRAASRGSLLPGALDAALQAVVSSRLAGEQAEEGAGEAVGAAGGVHPWGEVAHVDCGRNLRVGCTQGLQVEGDKGDVAGGRWGMGEWGRGECMPNPPCCAGGSKSLQGSKARWRCAAWRVPEAGRPRRGLGQAHGLGRANRLGCSAERPSASPAPCPA